MPWFFFLQFYFFSPPFPSHSSLIPFIDLTVLGSARNKIAKWKIQRNGGKNEGKEKRKKIKTAEKARWHTLFEVMLFLKSEKASKFFFFKQLSLMRFLSPPPSPQLCVITKKFYFFPWIISCNSLPP